MQFEYEFEELGIIYPKGYRLGSFSGCAIIEIVSPPQREMVEVYGRDIPVDHNFEWEISSILLNTDRYNRKTNQWENKLIICPTTLYDQIVIALTKIGNAYAESITEECIKLYEN